jgi:crossover junction endodeoxyribonuclease RuvC
VIVGVDPGLTGALALVTRYGELVDVVDMPVIDKVVSGTLIRQTLDGWTRACGDLSNAVVERVQTRPGHSGPAVLRTGMNYGILIGAFSSMRLPIVNVSAAKWKRDLCLGASKDASRARAVELWPEHAGRFARVKDDGRAEAALIGLWGVRA